MGNCPGLHNLQGPPEGVSFTQSSGKESSNSKLNWGSQGWTFQRLKWHGTFIFNTLSCYKVPCLQQGKQSSSCVRRWPTHRPLRNLPHLPLRRSSASEPAVTHHICPIVQEQLCFISYEISCAMNNG